MGGRFGYRRSSCVKCAWSPIPIWMGCFQTIFPGHLTALKTRSIFVSITLFTSNRLAVEDKHEGYAFSIGKARKVGFFCRRLPSGSPGALAVCGGTNGFIVLVQVREKKHAKFFNQREVVQRV